MADKKISELTELTTPDGTEELVVNDSGTSKKITQTNLLSTALPLAGGTMTGILKTPSVMIGDSEHYIYQGDADSLAFRVGDSSYDYIVFKEESGSGGSINAAGGNLEIKRAGVTKLATTSTGVDVTGSVTCDGFTSTGIDDNATSTAITINSSDNVGIGITNPYSPFQVKTTGNALSHFGGTQGASGTYQGISLGHSESSVGTYRKTAIVAESTGDAYTRQDFNILVDISADGNSAVLGDSKFKISGTTGICNAKNGITFGTDTAAANALDDYEEGTWTPTIVQGATLSTISTANYTKVGRLVTIQFHITISGGNANELRIGGLPFTVKTGNFCTGVLDSSSGTSNRTPFIRSEGAATYLRCFYEDRTSYAGNQAVGSLISSVTYMT